MKLEQKAVFNNYGEANKFFRHWDDLTGFIRESSGVRKFPAVVIYKWATRSITESTTVRMTVVGYGEEFQIDISETEILTVEKFHLCLSADFQTYTYNESRHSLIIKGESPKMKGTYEIEIIPAAGN